MHLLDTHTLVWAVVAPDELPPRVRKILVSGDVKVSVVSYWELAIKKGRWGAPVHQPATWWERYVTRPAVEVLLVRVAHLDRLEVLPAIHKDPFDRMLVAQALVEQCALISCDEKLARYDVPVIWK
jgi:PIN domain nuclease of toxin-antitoxin system